MDGAKEWRHIAASCPEFGDESAQCRSLSCRLPAWVRLPDRANQTEWRAGNLFQDHDCQLQTRKWLHLTLNSAALTTSVSYTPPARQRGPAASDIRNTSSIPSPHYLQLFTSYSYHKKLLFGITSIIFHHLIFIPSSSSHCHPIFIHRYVVTLFHFLSGPHLRQHRGNLWSHEGAMRKRIFSRFPFSLRAHSRIPSFQFYAHSNSRMPESVSCDFHCLDSLIELGIQASAPLKPVESGHWKKHCVCMAVLNSSRFL